jgi:hypothetical protein
MPCELAEIVFEKPLSGEFEEVLFGSDRGNTLWVKFSDKDGSNEWIGKFGVGSFGPERVIKVAEPDSFFISAGGFVYLFDATKREVVYQYHNPVACDIIYDPKRQLLIVADYTQLHWIDFGNKVLFSKQVALDGIRDLKINGHILTGLAVENYEGHEKRFSFDLDALKILRWENVSGKKRWGSSGNLKATPTQSSPAACW